MGLSFPFFLPQMIGVISIIAKAVSVIYHMCVSQGLTMCAHMYSRWACVSMCSRITLSGHSEGKGQGGDLKGWGNPFSFSTSSTSTPLHPPPLPPPYLRLFPAKQLDNVFSRCWTRTSGHLHRLKPPL